AESRFSRRILSQPGSSRSRNGTAQLDSPALFTTMSTCPSRAVAGAGAAAGAPSPAPAVGARDACLGRALPGDAGGDDKGLAPGLGRLFRGRGEPVLAPGAQRDGGSRVRERERARLA